MMLSVLKNRERRNSKWCLTKGKVFKSVSGFKNEITDKITDTKEGKDPTERLDRTGKRRKEKSKCCSVREKQYKEKGFKKGNNNRGNHRPTMEGKAHH